MTSKLWEKTLERLREKVKPGIFEIWLRPLKFVSREGSIILLAAPHKFFKEQIEDKHLDMLTEAATQEFGPGISIDIHVEPDESDSHPQDAGPTEFPTAQSTDPRHRTLESGLVPAHTFDRFVVGKGNELAQAASLAVANEPGRSYNPLFIYSGVGLGKTHLLHAIGNEALVRNPRLKVRYLTSEKFTNEFIACMRTNRMHMFKERYRSTDILLIDDIQFLGGKESTQEEFFHTFNELHSTGKQIVVSADKFPKEIIGLEERLLSRFAWGLVVDIQAPDLETRVAILNRKAEAEKINLSSDVAFFLAKTIRANIRDLEGALSRIVAHASLLGRPVDVDVARDIISRYISTATTETSPDAIVKAVAERYGVKISDLKSDRKHKTVALPRQIAMYLIRKMTRCSFPDIGQRFGKDHSTVMYAVKKIESAITEDVSLKVAVEDLRKVIEG